MEIPRIIHQIWGGHKPLPEHFIGFSKTWRNNHPDWKYEFWDDMRIEHFVREYYPQYFDLFGSFPQDMQRWDTVRYLIFDKMGGLYADFDSECFKPLDVLLEDKSCWFALEPVEYARFYNKDVYLSSAIMGSIPGHPFIRKMIDNIFNHFNQTGSIASVNKVLNVIKTTGPLMLTATYEQYSDPASIALIPRKYIAAFTHAETHSIIQCSGYGSEALEEKISEAYAVHYFFNDWIPCLR